MVKIAVKEELLDGKIISEWLFDWNEKRITLEDLIIAKVEKQLQEKESQLQVSPKLMEQILNQDKKEMSLPKIDRKKAIEEAIQAFKSTRFFVLVDGIQIDELQTKLEIKSKSSIQFIRLTPLIGG
ncbi:MAG: hypothetical protein L6Q78_14035 [Bacteroidia bacterium]|nr:hypothetical protein [Bacteroidia bacterium]